MRARRWWAPCSRTRGTAALWSVEGDQDVIGFIRAIREIGYTGPWGVEILSSEHRRLPLMEALKAAHDTTLQAFEALDARSTETAVTP